MAEVSFDTLEGLDRTPVGSETGASIVSGFKRWITVNGPFKTEYVLYQQGNGDDFANSDTFISILAHPVAVEVAFINGDAAAVAEVPSASLEGVESAALFKTVTVRDADAINGIGIIVKVHGY